MTPRSSSVILLGGADGEEEHRRAATDLAQHAAQHDSNRPAVVLREVVEVPVSLVPERFEWVGMLAELTRQIAAHELPDGCLAPTYEALTVAINQATPTATVHTAPDASTASARTPRYPAATTSSTPNSTRTPPTPPPPERGRQPRSNAPTAAAKHGCKPASVGAEPARFFSQLPVEDRPGRSALADSTP
jgi:hypothetical protein